jgi:hypothetical protein
MGKASRQKRRVSVAAAKRSRGNVMWYAVTALVVVVGVALVVVSMGENSAAHPLPNEDHWHAALGVNVCGTWQPNPPEFEFRAGSQVRAGLHSHGDGLMHIHPFSSDEAGDNATVGAFFTFGGWSVSEDSFSIWGGMQRSNGDECNGEPATVRWSVNGEERSGDPGDYQPQDGDIVAIALLPEGDEIGEPPAASNLAAPNDVEPTTPTTAPGATTAPPGSTGAPTTTTAAPSTPTP